MSVARTRLRAPRSAAWLRPSTVDGSQVEQAGAVVLETCQSRGISADLLRSLLTDAGMAEAGAAVGFVFGEDDRRPTRRDMARLVHGVDKALELGEPLAVDVRGISTRVAQRAREVVTGAVFVLCVWLVVGGILTGENATARSTSPALTIAVLACSLVCLALLEAAHIGAVALSTSDVSELRQSHPRVFKLHPFIATKERLENYLAGRQAGVVLVVFAVAAVTRTNGIQTLPGTDLHLPSFGALLFNIGVPGALMVLVIGQVAPQLVTARRPAAMMNTAPMAVAFTITRYIAKLGLASPARWLTGPSTTHERIPTAPRARYEAAVRDVAGHGVDTVRRCVHVGMSESISETVTTTVFTRGAFASHTVEVAATHFPPSATEAYAGLLRHGGHSEVVALRSDVLRRESGCGSRFFETLAPRLGTFEPADMLRTTFSARIPERVEADSIFISGPTRLVVLEVTLEHAPTPLPPARFTVVDANGEVVEAATVMPTMSEADGSVGLVAQCRYPAPGSIINLSWGSQL